ncbi:MAG: type IV toxin-antitoxin system AbiEi family antitoxin domain-containing protein, partial [Actinobacteria bacterium]|nr:type IV toxin-antitoxin system AbiEi family antitoxin domain-containing protein [Actinomycetota bacterium]
MNKINKVFKKHGGFARTNDILAAGIHRRDIKRIRDEGRIIRVKRGLYRLSDIPLVSNQGYIDLARAVPEGVICLLSALSYYELTTFNPSVISMVLCRGRRRPKIEYPPVEFYYFSKKQFKAGVNEIKIKGHKISIYCPEKTICDCFRYRSKLGLDIAKEGLSEYLKLKDRNL